MDDNAMKPLSPISRQLRERRRERGLSLAQVASRSGTSVAAVSRYENGWTRFELYTLRKLAASLGCELSVSLTPRERPGQPEPAEVVARVGRLFWDRRLEVRDLEESTTWVVERVLEYGDLEDVRLLVGLLGRDGFLQRVSEARFSSDRARVFWEKILEREGVQCTRRYSRKGAETSWRTWTD
jgi:transcriptional regulator with XRE-family HTH domain